MTTQTAATNPNLDALARNLGVTAKSLAALGFTPNGRSVSYPERDDTGKIIGTIKRTPTGKKVAAKGSTRGLTFAVPLDKNAGRSPDNPVSVVEGATDTAARMDLGFVTIGVPMAGYGGRLLRVLLADRHVAVLKENDRAGEIGAPNIAREIKDAVASVRIFSPPENVKDLREWKNARHRATMPR